MASFVIETPRPKARPLPFHNNAFFLEFKEYLPSRKSPNSRYSPDEKASTVAALPKKLSLKRSFELYRT